MLHFVREVIHHRVVAANRHVNRAIPDEHHPPTSTSPAVDHSPSQDRRQPCSLTAPARKTLPALPRTAQCLLHDILGIVRIAYQTVGDPIQCRGVFVDQDTKVRPRKRHPCLSLLAAPLPQVIRICSFPITCGPITGGWQPGSRPMAARPVTHSITSRQSSIDSRFGGRLFPRG